MIIRYLKRDSNPPSPLTDETVTLEANDKVKTPPSFFTSPQMTAHSLNSQ